MTTTNSITTNFGTQKRKTVTTTEYFKWDSDTKTWNPTDKTVQEEEYEVDPPVPPIIPSPSPYIPVPPYSPYSPIPPYTVTWQQVHEPS